MPSRQATTGVNGMARKQKKRAAKESEIGPLPEGWVRAATDGACAGNPGKMGLGGWLREPDGRVVAVFSAPAGKGTNNEAEFAAIAQVIELAVQYGARGICLRSDSELVVKQIRGEYQVRNARLRPLYERACAALERLPEGGRFHWINREENTEADALASRAIGADRGWVDSIGAQDLREAASGSIEQRPDVQEGTDHGEAPASGNSEKPDELTIEEAFTVIENRHGQTALSELLEALGPQFDSRYGLTVIRWCADGLTPDDALARAAG